MLEPGGESTGAFLEKAFGKDLSDVDTRQGDLESDPATEDTSLMMCQL